MNHPGLSNRTFGFAIGGALLVVSAVWWFGFGIALRWLPAVAAVLWLTALARPGLLLPLNLLWSAITSRIARLTNFLILSALFYLVITPFGLAMRLGRRDPLERRVASDRDSYLTPVRRQITTETLADQF